MSSKKWIVRFSRQAEKDLNFWRMSNDRIFQKCLGMLRELEVDPTNLETTGQPEWLKGELLGCMSRRITRADRCVYQVLKKKKIIKVLQMRFHYDDS